MTVVKHPAVKKQVKSIPCTLMRGTGRDQTAMPLETNIKELPSVTTCTYWSCAKDNMFPLGLWTQQVEIINGQSIK